MYSWPHTQAPAKTPGRTPPAALRLSRPRAPEASKARPSSRPVPGRPQGPLCARSAEPRPRPSARSGRTRARSADGQGCLHRRGRLLLGPGGGPAGLLRASSSGPPRASLSHPRRAPPAGPPSPPADGSAPHKVPSSAGRSAPYLGSWARARRARGGRRTGAPGPSAWWGAGLSGGAGNQVRGPQPHARRAAGTHSAGGWAGGGGGCAGPRPAATIPPTTESRAAWGVAAPARGGACSARRPRLRLPGAPRAPAHAALRPRPFASSLRAAGRTFLLPLSPPLPPAPRPPPGGRAVSLRRGGASSRPGQLRPARGPARTRRRKAPRWKSLRPHLAEGGGGRPSK